MNSELKLTDEQLRSATSRSLPPGAALDAETAVARESFLAWGSEIEASAGDIDAAAMLACISSSREQTCSRSFTAHNPWPLILSGALAAGMLLAVALIAIEKQQR